MKYFINICKARKEIEKTRIDNTRIVPLLKNISFIFFNDSFIYIPQFFDFIKFI